MIFESGKNCFASRENVKNKVTVIKKVINNNKETATGYVKKSKARKIERRLWLAR
jgi:hypothetical protein